MGTIKNISTLAFDPAKLTYSGEQRQFAYLFNAGNIHKFPVREPNGMLNVNAVKSACTALLTDTTLGEDAKKGVASALVPLYQQIGEDVPDALVKLADVSLTEATVFLSDGDAQPEGTNRFWKRILYEGRFLHPQNPSKSFTLTKEQFSKAIENFKSRVLDRVSIFATHQEDPRNLAGKVLDMKQGTDPRDNRHSLYALLEGEDPNLVRRMEENSIGVSAYIDSNYKDHESGEDKGFVVRHVALVGEGWIKRLGDFIPVKQFGLSEAMAYLTDSGGGAVYEDPDADDKDGKKKRSKMPTLAELKASLKEASGIDVDALLAENTTAKEDVKRLTGENENLKKITPASAAVQKLGEAFGLSEAELKDTDKGIEAIITKYTTMDQNVKTAEAAKAVGALLAENKITKAQEPTFIKMYLSAPDLFKEFTANLKSGAVPLGEEGKDDPKDPSQEGKDDEQITRYTELAEKSGIPIASGELVGANGGKKK